MPLPLTIRWNAHEMGDRSGIPVLFLHGFMAQGGIWLPIMRQLNHRFHSVALDLPGHGLTTADIRTLDFDNLSGAIVDYIDEHIKPPVILVGYSMGGRIALHTALNYPDHFSGLVLESAGAGIENAAEREFRLAVDEETADRLTESDLREFLKEWYRTQPIFSSLSNNPEMIESIINKKMANDPELLAGVMVRLSPGRQIPLWPRLHEWKKPTLIIAGELDPKYRDIARRLATEISGAGLEIIPGAGHIVHLENSKAFIATLKNFLSAYIL